MVKNLPAMWETQVRSLGQEDPLEKCMTTHSRILFFFFFFFNFFSFIFISWRLITLQYCSGFVIH